MTSTAESGSGLFDTFALDPVIGNPDNSHNCRTKPLPETRTPIFPVFPVNTLGTFEVA